MESSGILVGADRRGEWLLDFWWANYSKHNKFPVSFVDFGMSKKAQKWCAARGELIALGVHAPAAMKARIERAQALAWEERHGKEIWHHRTSWYKKPFALLLSPYEKTVWLDLDCEVLGPLDALFAECKEEVALVKEPETAHKKEAGEGRLLPGETLYNSGVILYRKGAALLHLFAQAVALQSKEFWGDQQLLSRLIHLHKLPVQELAAEYNWRMSQGVHFNAFIVHWVGPWGKAFIRKYGGLSGYLK
jgi:hypothetical protein